VRCGARYEADDSDPERESEVVYPSGSSRSCSSCSVLVLALAFGAPSTFLDVGTAGRSIGVAGVAVPVDLAAVTFGRSRWVPCSASWGPRRPIRRSETGVHPQS
jgi:hypothetical protein